MVKATATYHQFPRTAMCPLTLKKMDMSAQISLNKTTITTKIITTMEVAAKTMQTYQLQVKNVLKLSKVWNPGIRLTDKHQKAPGMFLLRQAHPLPQLHPGASPPPATAPTKVATIIIMLAGAAAPSIT